MPNKILVMPKLGWGSATWCGGNWSAVGAPGPKISTLVWTQGSNPAIPLDTIWAKMVHGQVWPAKTS